MKSSKIKRILEKEFPGKEIEISSRNGRSRIYVDNKLLKVTFIDEKTASKISNVHGIDLERELIDALIIEIKREL